MLAERIAPWEEALPPYLKLAYLPNPGAVRLRLSAYEVEGESVAREIAERFEALKEIIPEYVVGYETATVQELVHGTLTGRGETLATAESCTGGAIAARFTAMAGASAYFRGGVVAYSNDLKREVLGVSATDLERFGAVSEPVARQMAEGFAASPARTTPSPPRASQAPRAVRTKTRRHGLDRRRRTARHRRRMPPVRHRSRTDHRPRIGIRHRDAPRRPEAINSRKTKKVIADHCRLAIYFYLCTPLWA